MAEASAVPPQNAFHRGSHHFPRGRRGGRGTRGHQHRPVRSNADHGEAQTAQQVAATRSEVPPTASSIDARDVQPQRGGRSGGGRGDRGRQGGQRRGRGGSSQRSVVVSHRGGRAPPPHLPVGGGSSIGPGLRASAPEFVPGQSAPPLGSGLPPSSDRARDLQDGKFRGQATDPSAAAKSSAADLPTRIHEDVDNGQYECVICTNEVLRNSRVWSCSICWTVAHLHCVRKWHTNQLKERDENQGSNRPEGWRCPGCNSTLIEAPGSYHCWCGKDVDPKPIPGLPPHTCGQTCNKPRATCPHPCSLMCHAGPCPPCTLMGPTQMCFCGKNSSTKRCSETDYGKGWSCQEPCGDLLPCGEHTCAQPCHPGLCGACEVPILSTCYCGKEQRQMPCNQREDIEESFNYGQLNTPLTAVDTDLDSNSWFEGSFRCGNICGRVFDCGHHACQKQCHAQNEEAAHCPLSPDVVTHCPCGKTTLDSMAAKARESCQDPVPHCDEPCNKVLACGHLCPDKCHTGSCASCTQIMEISCRCGRTMAKSACHQGTIVSPHCFRVCKAQLNCGRHECGERCCSGEKKAAERRKQKRNNASENYEPEHICLQVCGRQLKCGKHTCQQLCHKGACMSCPEAIFDDISCSCGRTVLQPPQPCGTRPPECRFPCRRQRPCGHPSVEHQCHPDETPCPKCPFLVERPCICGKKTLKNQPCWFEEARCGLPCGKKLKCGAHECKKPCHKPGECEDAGISGSHCTQLCGKIRTSCEHTCVEQCHAPYPCKEDKPCQSKTFITCPCQHRKQEVRCQATKLNPWPNKEATLKCDDECLRLQRNRKLAEALSIDPDTHNDDHIPYSDTTLKLFRENINWAQEREREFRGFAAAQDEKRLRFKPMQSHQRAFLHALAADFGLDSESQDPEPHRHVCVFKTPRFVSAPRKTLAQCLRIAKTAANLAAAASSLRPTAVSPAPHKPEGQAFNALLLKEPRFGLTIDELDDAIAADLASAAARLPLTFTTSFLPSSEEIVIKATSKATAAAIATSLAPTPQAIESTLSILKSAVARTVSRLGLVSGGVSLCHADGTGSITRREGDGPGAGNTVAAASTDGWSAVASRGSWRRTAAGTNKTATAPANLGEQRAPSAFVALRRLELKKKKAEKASRVVAKEEPVEEDWLVAAEKLVGGEEEEEGGLQEKGSESEGGSGTGSGSEDGLGVAGDTLKDGVGDGERGGADQGVKREHEGVPAVGVDGPAVALRLV